MAFLPGDPPAHDGGYEAGYRSCPCFWGTEPASLVRLLVSQVAVRDWRVLDLGCGEGKNAAFLAERGANVIAVDVSDAAIANGNSIWPDTPGIEWRVADVMPQEFSDGEFDLVVAYGLFHCLESESIEPLIKRVKGWTRAGGRNVVVAFNDRAQDLAGHPGFCPTLLTHQFYLGQYSDWRLDVATDQDLVERHPNNEIEHSHSLTRLIATRR
ncbi:class I SAM-dependent methyltransferase [Pseudonocardia sp. ICBG1142]|uniref:class I SAM-dependent methyltransferase n=1 Tax=Pseudonocardia sp. ICBG1142 TaxID=2846760 RepID=UPI001CF67BA3|nr:class I SAM-dependent methyltransferase [Pseudonocardia sp. ICBG1142]